jgi:hypothetical protein
MITPEVNADSIRAAIKELKAVDKTLLAELRKDLRSKIGPLAKQIANDVPTEPPLSGFARQSSFGWGPVRPTITFTPGRSRKTGDHLVAIRIAPPKGTRGLYVSEIAGSRSRGKNARGQAMIRNLNEKRAMKGKGGRFAYAKFRLLRPDAMRLATMIVNQTLAKINKRLDF